MQGRAPLEGGLAAQRRSKMPRIYMAFLIGFALGILVATGIALGVLQ